MQDSQRIIEATIYVDGLSVDIVTDTDADGRSFISLEPHAGVSLSGEMPGQYYVERTEERA